MKHDRSDETVVTVCPCGWRAISFSLDRADAAGFAHLRRAHPGDRSFRNPFELAVSRRRRADATRPVG